MSSDAKFCPKCGQSNGAAAVVKAVKSKRDNSALAPSIVAMSLGIVSLCLPPFMALFCGLSLTWFAWLYWGATILAGIFGIASFIVSAVFSKKVVTSQKLESSFLTVAKITRIFGLIFSILAILLPTICATIAILFPLAFIGLALIAYAILWAIIICYYVIIYIIYFWYIIILFLLMI